MAFAVTAAGSATTNNNTTLSAALTTNFSVGDVVVLVGMMGQGSNQTFSFSDSQGNVYSLGAFHPASGNTRFQTAYCTVVNPLTTSDTVTFAQNGSANALILMAVKITGMFSPTIDVDIGVVGSGTSSSRASGVLAQTNEVLFGVLGLENNGGSHTVTDDATWTSLYNLNTISAHDGAHGVMAYAIVAANTSKTYAPAWTISDQYTSFVVSFYALMVNHGVVGATIDPVTLVATGGRPSGVLAATIGPVGLAAAGALTVKGAVNATIAPITTVSAAQLIIGGTSSGIIGPVTLNATAHLSASGVVNALIGPVGLTASGTHIARGVTGATIGPVVLAAHARRRIGRAQMLLGGM